MNKPEAKQRTLQQNRALHLMFRQLSDQLNESGMTINKTISKPIELPWTPYLIKEILWRMVQIALLGKRSTTELTTAEIDEVFEVIARHLATMDIVIDFPSIETIMLNQQLKDL